ncbi:MAG: hypothetical protein V3T98_01710 [Candidatus Paceibacterota bacterium]
MVSKEMKKKIEKQMSLRRKTGNWTHLKRIHKRVVGYGSNLEKGLNVKNMSGDISALWGGDGSKVSGDMSMFSGDITGIKATAREILFVLNGNNKKYSKI